MHTHVSARRRSDPRTQTLRNEAGRWLCELRNKRGLSQSQLAQRVGEKSYMIISQFENGRARVHPDRYLVWAYALGVEPRRFVRELMSYYDPVTYGIIFGPRSPSHPGRALRVSASTGTTAE
jgi:transcriptional regulator with XRE-family HTH domain